MSKQLANLTKLDLDIMAQGNCACESPICEHKLNGRFYLHSACHREYPVWAHYDSNLGAVVIECAKCRNLIARISVGNS